MMEPFITITVSAGLIRIAIAFLIMGMLLMTMMRRRMTNCGCCRPLMGMERRKCDGGH
jgi:hypothetical protein